MLIFGSQMCALLPLQHTIPQCPSGCHSDYGMVFDKTSRTKAWGREDLTPRKSLPQALQQSPLTGGCTLS